MKPFYELINYPTNSSLIIRCNYFPHFSVPLHYHDEYEIVYVIKSFGKKFVGDVVEDFSPGDLTLFGTRLPHFFMNDQSFYNGDPSLFCQAIVLQFPENYIPESQLQLPEFAAVKKLLKNSANGLNFSSETAEIAGSLLDQALHSSGMERHLVFVKLIDFLGNASFKPIASPGYKNKIENPGEDRMLKLNTYVTRNCTQEITIEKAASVAGMNSTAFCRYFKQKTGKTFVNFLNELRIGHACKFLRHGTQPIQNISEEAGFNNISNFNRQFKKITGKSPKEYRELNKEI
jgi:AraC-like DNA-binding protein